MKIDDVVYGTEKINERVLIELINSPPLQRLKGVSQFGVPDKYYHKKGFSRFDHSLGVLILLGRLGASLEERVAGLLHDTSHTAFSHVVDWINGDPTKEDHQDKTLLETFENTEIKDVLRKQGFNYRTIANIESYSLLEQPAPDLCADRVDYALREIAYTKSKSDAIKIFRDLDVYSGKIVFGSLDSAKLFSKYYMEFNKYHWAEDEARARYYILADVLRSAIKKDIISFEDLKGTEDEILEKAEKSEDEKILYGLNLLKKGFSLEHDREGVLLLKKFRHIDPFFLDGGNVVRLSSVSKEYHNLLMKEKVNSKYNNKFKINPILK